MSNRMFIIRKSTNKPEGKSVYCYDIERKFCEQQKPEEIRLKMNDEVTYVVGCRFTKQLFIASKKQIKRFDVHYKKEGLVDFFECSETVVSMSLLTLCRTEPPNKLLVTTNTLIYIHTYDDKLEELGNIEIKIKEPNVSRIKFAIDTQRDTYLACCRKAGELDFCEIIEVDKEGYKVSPEIEDNQLVLDFPNTYDRSEVLVADEHQVSLHILDTKTRQLKPLAQISKTWKISALNYDPEKKHIVVVMAKPDSFTIRVYDAQKLFGSREIGQQLLV